MGGRKFGRNWIVPKRTTSKRLKYNGNFMEFWSPEWHTESDFVIVFKQRGSSMHSLSIRRFWGKGEKWKRKRERGEGEKRLTQMLLLEPSTPTQHDSIPSNQNHLRSGRAPVLVLLRFRFFLKPPMRSFRILVM